MKLPKLLLLAGLSVGVMNVSDAMQPTGGGTGGSEQTPPSWVAELPQTTLTYTNANGETVGVSVPRSERATEQSQTSVSYRTAGGEMTFTNVIIYEGPIFWPQTEEQREAVRQHRGQEASDRLESEAAEVEEEANRLTGRGEHPRARELRNMADAMRTRANEMNS